MKQQNLMQLAQEEWGKFKTLINGIVDEVWFCDRDGEITMANRAALEGLGIEISADAGTKLPKLISSLQIYCEDGTPRLEEDAPLLRSLRGEVLAREIEIIRHPKTGKMLYRQISSAPLKDINGHIFGAVAVVRDVTTNKQLEMELNDTKTLLENVYASLEEAIFVVDPATRLIISCNTAAEKIFGYPAEEIIGQNTRFLYETEEQYLQFGKELFPALDTHGVFQKEFNLRKKDGTILPTDHTAKEIRDPTGERTIVVSVVRDMTRQKKMIDHLKQNEKDLEEKSAALEETNTALRVLLDQREKEKNHYETLLAENINGLLIPYIERLKQSELNSEQNEYLTLLESAIREMFKPALSRIYGQLLHLSPAETRIAKLIKEGLQTKEISNLL